MIGTLINAVAVLVGSAAGMLAGNRISVATQQSIIMGLGFVTLSIGISNSFATGNMLIPLFSVVLGVIIGEVLNIQGKLNGLGGWLQSKVGTSEADPASPGMSEREKFINGFVTASLVFCVGPLTVMGSLADGMSGDYQLLTIKSALDMFAAMAFASSLGVGVSFSVITILVVQGGIALVGFAAGNVMSQNMINELTAAGGLLLMGLSLILMDIKQPRIANYLPALLVAPLIVGIAEALGLNLYPSL